jgi:DNA-directed RNA polymerase subunit RPC12/RpoP
MEKRFIYMCDTCLEGFSADISIEEEPNAEVHCPYCHSLETRFVSENLMWNPEDQNKESCS